MYCLGYWLRALCYAADADDVRLDIRRENLRAIAPDGSAARLAQCRFDVARRGPEFAPGLSTRQGRSDARHEQRRDDERHQQLHEREAGGSRARYQFATSWVSPVPPGALSAPSVYRSYWACCPR